MCESFFATLECELLDTTVIVAGSSGVSVRGPFARFANVSSTAWGIVTRSSQRSGRGMARSARKRAFPACGLRSNGLVVEQGENGEVSQTVSMPLPTKST